ncbi:MAG: CoA-disulfide reductase [Brevinematales bacterium]|nr:CoA-disulfide reductase [Brevinematales bacterium]
MAKYVIVGGVAGGMSAAARLRRLDETADITVFEKGGYISYANCGLPYYIGDVITDKEKLFLQTPEAFYNRFRVKVLVKHEVLAIEREKKRVRVKNLMTGQEFTEPYDKLVLSPGAEPVRPPLPGIEEEGIFTLRSVEDTLRLKEYIQAIVKPHKRAVVIGGGFIGLEMAENLHHAGFQVTLVELAPQVMVVIDFEMAALVHDHLRSKGVALFLEEAAEGFRREGSEVVVKLKSGREIRADVVIMSIGVKPETRLASQAGLALGDRGIQVNEYLQTSDPDIYAIGDAIEIRHRVTGKIQSLPLAWPANQQGRLVADNLVLGHTKPYKGDFATAIAKVFDLTVATTGANEKSLEMAGVPFTSVIYHGGHHAGYYPGATQLSLKLLFSPTDGKILGAQAVGYDGVDKRVDVLAMALLKEATIYDLTDWDHAYAPPFSSAKDPVNMVGFMAENVLSGLVKTIDYKTMEKLKGDGVFLLDVRTPQEFASGAIPGAVNIPVDHLRERLSEIPRNKKIFVYCRVGLRGYIASRILVQAGWKEVYNLSGGYLTYSAVMKKQSSTDGHFEEGVDTGVHSIPLQVSFPSKTVKLDVCGLQCPGPISRVKQEIDKLRPGDTLEVLASDPGFYNDVGAWAKATGNRVESLSLEKGIVHAKIVKGEDNIPGSQVISSGNEKTIIVFDGDLDKAIASFIIANGALAMGRKVTMFFTFWGLTILRKTKKVRGLKKNLIETMFGWMLPRGSTKLPLSKMNMWGIGPRMIRFLMRRKRVDTLETMIQSAIAGGARLIACQMSMDLMGIRREELIDGIEVGGVATYLETAERADTNLFI